MPARLSSLLVRDGLVGVKRMEKAFQRQVIYGGSLDTILLEMNLLPEDRLTQYLALASGLPPAARDEAEALEPEAVALLDRDLAQQYRAVPLALDGDAVRILVCSPLELAALEDLADALDRPIQPLISPEYRWHMVYAAAYALDPPARFSTLARTLDTDATPAPVGRAKSVIIDETQKTLTPAPVAQIKLVRTTAPLPSVEQVFQDHLDSEIADVPLHTRTVTKQGVVPARTSAQRNEDEVTQPIEISPRDLPPEIEKPKITFRTPSTGVPDHVAQDASSGRPERPKNRALKMAQTAPIATSGRDTPMTVVGAREVLAVAEDRDTVFLTLLQAIRSRARWAGLLTVQGGAAIGRVALAEPSLDTAAINTVLIPLDVVSPFRTVVANHQPHIGSMISNDPSIDAMVLRMGGVMPPSALLLPIVIRDRVVAIVVAHRVHSDIRLADVTELLPMATAASDAIARLIVRSKAAGYRAPEGAPVVEIEAGAVETKRIVNMRDTGKWTAPPQRPTPVPFEQGTELSIDAEPPRPIDTLLDEIEKSGEGTSGAAMTEAVERANETIASLMQRFPGKLRIDRFNVVGRPLRAAQYGGLLELVIQLGTVASELLIEKMGAPQRDVRFYATVCVTELRPRNAVYALAERLFDQDFGVRACAIEALAGYPIGDLGHALVRARRAVHSNDPEVVNAATAAIIELRDTDAIADLIGVIERTDRGGDLARKALTTLTAQDFGPSEKKWRRWHEAARGKHRIEWLIDGLTHKEDTIREAAINDLRRVTGEYFGYHYDLPRRERDAAAERWAAWWRDSGHRRFTMPREDERHRPTALIPIRRDPA
jgi:Type II secretion system (T2SS), protein E, N-terminal domain